MKYTHIRPDSCGIMAIKCCNHLAVCSCGFVGDWVTVIQLVTNLATSKSTGTRPGKPGSDCLHILEDSRSPLFLTVLVSPHGQNFA